MYTDAVNHEPANNLLTGSQLSGRSSLGARSSGFLPAKHQGVNLRPGDPPAFYRTSARWLSTIFSSE
jgi:hypothetical protein